MRNLLSKILILTTLILSQIVTVEAKIFKSKNGYKFEIPKDHKVVERDYAKLYKKNNKKQKDVDDNMLQENVEVTDQYINYVFSKKEKDPDIFHSSISTSNKEFEITDFDKDTWCPDFAAYFDQMVITKNVDTYICEIDKTVRSDLPAIKFVYDSIKDKTFMHHYMFNINNKSVNVAGICLLKGCDDLDKNLRSIIKSFSY